ncbi:MAG: hypothetical protein ACKVS6_13360 [Planctomycetota bacterium]
MSFTVDVVDTLNDAIPPANDSIISDAVRKSLHIVVDRTGGRINPTFIQPVQDRPPASELLGVALALDIDVLCNGAVLASIACDPYCYNSDGRVETTGKRWNDIYSGTYITAIPNEVLTNENVQAGWSLRIRGTHRDILKLWGADSWWNGEIVVPLREAIRKKL